MADTRFILSQNFADIIYELVMPGKLLMQNLRASLIFRLFI